MNVTAVAPSRIIDLVKANSRVITALADLGIGPRYLYWTVDEVSRISASASIAFAAALTAYSLPPRKSFDTGQTQPPSARSLALRVKRDVPLRDISPPSASATIRG